MKLFLSVLLFTVFFSSHSFANCEAKRNDCGAYRCLEQDFKCGSKGYFINFGQRYCRQFLENRSNYSKRAQEWLKEVAFCLQEKAVDLPKNLNCGEVKEESLDDHVSCYNVTGFCDVPVRDKLRLYWELSGAVFQINVLEVSLRIHGNCL